MVHLEKLNVTSIKTHHSLFHQCYVLLILALLSGKAILNIYIWPYCLFETNAWNKLRHEGFSSSYQKA